jgi:hypothetical protein
MTARYIVDLTESERAELVALTSSGSTKARRYRRARVLLLADAGLPPNEIEAATGASSSSVAHQRSRATPSPSARPRRLRRRRCRRLAERLPTRPMLTRAWMQPPAAGFPAPSGRAPTA